MSAQKTMVAPRWRRGRSGALVLAIAALAGCAGGPTVDASKCQFVRHEDMCEATVTLEPRESESVDEATMLEIRWTWLGKAVTDVPDRVTRTHLTAKEARSLAEAVDDMGKSRCVVEQAVAPGECIGISRIVSVEAEP